MAGKARVAVIVAVAVASIAGTAHAAGNGDVSRYRLRSGNGPERLAMQCEGWAEDTASLWRLSDVDGDGVTGASGDRYVLRCVGEGS